MSPLRKTFFALRLSLYPRFLESLNFGPGFISTMLICFVGLGFFSVVDFREIIHKQREKEIAAQTATLANSQKELELWLKDQQKIFERYLSLTGRVEAVERDDTSSAEENLQETILRLQEQVAMLSEVQRENEDLFWYLPSISPISLTRDFTLYVGGASRGRLSGVSSKHGMRFHPREHKREMHHGLDIFCPEGTNVMAPANGTVVFAGRYSPNEDNLLQGYGNFILIRHGDSGIETLYAHLSSIHVQKGQWVTRGSTIGLTGNTGSSTGPHLHYEVIRGGEKVNPLHYIQDVPLVQDGKRVLYVAKKTSKGATKKRKT